MVKQIGPKTAIVSSKELGTSCWSTARFIRGKRCCQVMQCKYPEKKTCKAVDTEISILRQKLRDISEGIHATISKLIAERI